MTYTIFKLEDVPPKTLYIARVNSIVDKDQFKVLNRPQYCKIKLKIGTQSNFLYSRKFTTLHCHRYCLLLFETHHDKFILFGIPDKKIGDIVLYFIVYYTTGRPCIVYQATDIGHLRLLKILNLHFDLPLHTSIHGH